MSENNNIQELIAMLSGDEEQVKEALYYLFDTPIADERFLPHLETLLDDRRLCVLGVPYRYGELRWLVAEALAAQRSKLNIHDPVRLHGVVKPVTAWELEQLAENAGIDLKLNVFDKLRELIKLGKMPLQNRAFWPTKNSKE